MRLQSCWMKRCRKIQGVIGGRRACWFVAWKQAVMLFEGQLINRFSHSRHMNTRTFTVCEFLHYHVLRLCAETARGNSTASVQYCFNQSDLMKLSMLYFILFCYHGRHSIPCKFTLDKEFSVFAKASLCWSRGIVEWLIWTTVEKQLAPHWRLASTAAACLRRCPR